jgi:hypothetical protein
VRVAADDSPEHISMASKQQKERLLQRIQEIAQHAHGAEKAFTADCDVYGLYSSLTSIQNLEEFGRAKCRTAFTEKERERQKEVEELVHSLLQERK